MPINQSSSLPTGCELLVSPALPAGRQTDAAPLHDHVPGSHVTLRELVATAVRDRAGLLSATTHDWSSPPPLPVSIAAPAWLNRYRGWPQASATAGEGWQEARQSCETPGIGPTDPTSLLRPDTAC